MRPSINFRCNTELTAKAIEEYIHRKYADYLYEHTEQLCEEDGVPVIVCEYQFIIHSLLDINEVRDEVVKMLGEISDYYIKNN